MSDSDLSDADAFMLVMDLMPPTPREFTQPFVVWGALLSEHVRVLERTQQAVFTATLFGTRADRDNAIEAANIGHAIYTDIRSAVVNAVGGEEAVPDLIGKADPWQSITITVNADSVGGAFGSIVGNLVEGGVQRPSRPFPFGDSRTIETQHTEGDLAYWAAEALALTLPIEYVVGIQNFYLANLTNVVVAGPPLNLLEGY